MPSFTHLHCHTQYSLLDGAAKIHQLIKQTKTLGMNALAITDHGNMFGVPHFVSQAQQQGIKPIIGCEFYLAKDRLNLKDKKRYHQILLAKNKIGYQNLSKLCSLGFLEGYYYKPRIDKALIQQYAEGLIATTCCLASEIAQTIMQEGEDAAEKIFLSWRAIFGEDYYIELQKHGIEAQEKCNAILLKWAKKYQVKIIATNDVHYISQRDSTAQDILLCLQTGKDYHDPKRMRFANNQFFLKSPENMATLFKELPQAISNTQEIVDKVMPISLKRDVLLPIFQLPTQFTSQEDYLAHLTWQGAKKRYTSITEKIHQRITHELTMINNMGFPGYFLIVQDFVNAAKNMQVIVGPGRGSAAGSVVAYCIGITNIDPLKYGLIFERFLNPERISMPDIDIDFDDEGRQKVINYVVEKYGKNQVAQIITFGSMGAKSAIRDVARVLGVSLEQANYMAKLVPEKPGTTLAQAFKEVPELASLKKKIDTPEEKVLSFAETLEGSARHTGIHAAGIIIAPDNLQKYIPVKTDKNADLLVTQYDGSLVEDMGMLKMDFLGLKTLSIIRTALALIKKNTTENVDIENIPLNDEKTFFLYQSGNTIATFQFESEGMRQWISELQPTHINDLIAMNALYRPGPMQFIPNFIARKHGKERIIYPHPLLEKTLKNTYGIMVYQEQIMQTAQIIAGYTLAEADLLRRVMGKKKVEEMAKQKDIFIKKSIAKHNLSKEKAQSIFEIMEKFAQYGFPRAHAAAYSIIAYQTAYLKANYTAAYMAAVLTHNQNDIEKISFFLEECKKQQIQVLGPDINESQKNFDINTQSQIRFGLNAIKGTGEAAVESIIKEKKKGIFKNIYDFVERVNLRTVNKKTLESLSMAGAFDSFKVHHRKSYIYSDEKNNTVSFIENLIKYGQKIKQDRNAVQQSLFTLLGEATYQKKPEPTHCTPYSQLEKLKIEKEIIGCYISGHPLDPFKIELKYFCTHNTQNILKKKIKNASLGCIISTCTIKKNKHGYPFAAIILEDYVGKVQCMLFGETFKKNEYLLHEGALLYVQGDVSTKYNQENHYVLKIQNISMLEDIRRKLTKQIHIFFDVESINQEMIKSLDHLFKKYPGKCTVRIILEAKKEDMAVPTLVSNYKIGVQDNFLAALNSMVGLHYKLVK